MGNISKIKIGQTSHDIKDKALNERVAVIDEVASRLLTLHEDEIGRRYEKPSGGIPKTDMTSAVQTSLSKADTAYQKPSSGIPKSDLASAVQTSLNKADTAVQDISGKAEQTQVTEIDEVVAAALNDLNNKATVVVKGTMTSSPLAYFMSQDNADIATDAFSNGRPVVVQFYVGDTLTEVCQLLNISGIDSTPALKMVGSNGVASITVFAKPTANGVYIKYTDGSYSAYNSLSSGKTPVGVALKTDACAFTIHPSEGDSTKWSPNYTTKISGVTTTMDENSAKADYAGKANTASVIASGLAGSAFTWATEVTYADGSAGWLPSCGEMEQIRLNATNINTALSLIGGTAVDFSGKYYWSSTQSFVYSSWSWMYTNTTWIDETKDESHACRSVTYF